MLVVAVAAVVLALLGSLSHTSKRDVAFDAGAPVVATKHRPAGHDPAGTARAIQPPPT